MKKLQKILDANGFSHVRAIDVDHVAILVDGEEEFFNRDDEMTGQFGSGLAFYGLIYGDHRMIEHIYDDMQQVFELLKNNENENFKKN